MLSIHDKEPFDKPQERLKKYGASKLKDHELLAVILRTGSRGEDVLNFSHKVLKTHTSKGLQYVEWSELMQHKGMGEAKASQILAALELGRRLFSEQVKEKYAQPQDFYRALEDIRGLKREHFVAFFLDTRNQKIEQQVISIGTVNASIVHPREVFERAIRNSAVSVVLAHNHPSQNPEPSDADISVTQRLVKAGNLLGIEVADHIIVTKSGYWSFREHNLI